ncbi:MAG: hypothetical protein J0I20_23600 [Chloroflexi bacterium]|nr:hypothetical protein [Chloroflexota bacterium]
MEKDSRVKLRKIHQRQYFLILSLWCLIGLLTACGSDKPVVNETAPVTSSQTAPNTSVSSGAISSQTATMGNISKSPIFNSKPSAITPALSLSPAITPGTSKPVGPDGWQNRWLKGIPCRAPCFEGIIPGKTTATEALKLLQQNPLVINAKLNLHSPSSNSTNSITWEWSFLPTDDTSTGGEMDIYLNKPDQLINYIVPYFHSEYSLQEIIKAYGEPSHVSANFTINPNYSISYGLAIYYQNVGLSLSTGSISRKGEPNKLTLTPQTTFGSIVFYAPDLTGKIVYTPVPQDPAILIPWQGYKDFDFYCRDAVKTQVTDCSRAKNFNP